MKVTVKNPEEGDIFVTDPQGRNMTLPPATYELIWQSDEDERVLIMDEGLKFYIAQSYDFEDAKETVG